jgi:RNA polymerase sigma factor (sigma-70 family)
MVLGAATVAMARYQPEKGGFVGQLAWWLLSEIDRTGRRLTRHLKVSSRSLSDPILDTDGLCLSDSLGQLDDTCEVNDQNAADQARVAELLKLLPTARQREVIRLYYGLDGQPPMLQREIAGQVRVSRKRVSQVLSLAVNRIRDRELARIA